jgi:hypothetical protein
MIHASIIPGGVMSATGTSTSPATNVAVDRTSKLSARESIPPAWTTSRRADVPDRRSETVA